MTLTELSIKRPTLVVVFFFALIVLGIFSYSLMKYELLPKMSSPFVSIMTIYPGASPNEVETSVTKPIEDAVSGIDKISTIRSTSQEGVSFVMIEFLQSASVDVALQDAQRKVNEMLSKLPAGSKTPTLSKFALDELPVLRMGATASMPSRDFYQLLKDRLEPRLAKVPGVAQVQLIGGDEREIRVNVDATRLRTYGLSIMQINNAIKAANLDFPTGNIKDVDGQYVVRIAGKIASLDEMKQLIVGRSNGGGDIRLGDVAEIQDGQKDYTNISRLNGNTSIGVLVTKQTDANGVDVSKLVRAEVDKIQKDFAPQGVKFNIAQDQSLFTIDAADAVMHDLGLAIILVALVMLLFLHSVRDSVIVMIAIPTSLVSTMIAMYAFDFTLNLMTLLALSLVVGILVDDSIVVLENIHRHLEMGKNRRVAALDGRNEIGFTALSITLVDVVVFLPLSVLSGLIGNIMREFAVVIVVSTLLSLLVSFTVTPLLASRFSKVQHLTKGTIMGRFGLWFESLYDAFTRRYLGLLKWGLRHKVIVIVVTGVLFFSSFLLLAKGFIGFEFITQADRGEFSVAVELPPGSSIETTNKTTLNVEHTIRAIPEVQKVFVNVGASSEGLVNQSSSNVSDLTVTLVPKDKRLKSTDDIGDEIKAEIGNIPGVKVRINPIGIFGTANQTPIQIVASGTDLNQVQKGADLVASLLKKVPGTADVRLSTEDGKPETRIEIDRQKLASLGLTLSDVGNTLRVALTGDDDSKYRDGATEYDIRVMLDQFDRSQTADVAGLTFVNNRGELVELQQFANIYKTTGPTVLQRRDRNPAITVYAQTLGRPSGSIAQDFQKLLAASKLPAGVAISYDGDIKNQNDSFGSMLLAIAAGILFVYLIMVALYNSYIWPFVVLFSIPLAMIGAFLALALSAKSLSIFSMLGIIMLIGLVGKNAILLVDFTNKLREEGMGTLEALIEAGRTRLRPILMTTLTMIIGMLPIALASSAGAEWKSGLAWALIGGLSSSMLLTLVFVPVVYMTVDNIRRRVTSWRGKGARRNVIDGSARPEMLIPDSVTMVNMTESN